MFGRGAAPALGAGLVAEGQAVQLVGQLVDRGVQVKVLAAGVQGIALDEDAAFGALAPVLLRFVVRGQLGV